jgi:hypothetical protein
MIDPSYVEAILTVRNKERMDRVQRWLSDRGLQSAPMRAGLLAMGSRAAFETAFGIDLQHVKPPVRLEVPPELREVVSSIEIPPLRRIMP